MRIYLVIYLNQSNQIIYRVNRSIDYAIGDINGLGWLVLDIQIFHDNRFISLSEYSRYRSIRYRKLHKKGFIQRILKRKGM